MTSNTNNGCICLDDPAFLGEPADTDKTIGDELVDCNSCHISEGSEGSKRHVVSNTFGQKFEPYGTCKITTAKYHGKGPSTKIRASVKFSGSLVTCGAKDGRLVLTSKNTAANSENVFTNTFACMLISQLRETFGKNSGSAYKSFVNALEVNEITLGFEVITKYLGDHRAHELQPHMVLIMMVDQNTQQPLSHHAVRAFAKTFGLFSTPFADLFSTDIHELEKNFKEFRFGGPMTYKRATDIMWKGADEVSDSGFYELVNNTPVEGFVVALVDNNTECRESFWSVDINSEDTPLPCINLGEICEQVVVNTGLDQLSAQKELNRLLNECISSLPEEYRPYDFCDKLSEHLKAQVEIIIRDHTNGSNIAQVLYNLDRWGIHYNVNMSATPDGMVLIFIKLLSEHQFTDYNNRAEKEAEGEKCFIQRGGGYVLNMGVHHRKTPATTTQTSAQLDALAAYKQEKVSGLTKMKGWEYCLWTYCARNQGGHLVQQSGRGMTNTSSYLSSCKRIMICNGVPEEMMQEQMTLMLEWGEHILALPREQKQLIQQGVYIDIFNSFICNRTKGVVAKDQMIGLFIFIGNIDVAPHVATLMSAQVFRMSDIPSNSVKKTLPAILMMATRKRIVLILDEPTQVKVVLTSSAAEVSSNVCFCGVGFTMEEARLKAVGKSENEAKKIVQITAAAIRTLNGLEDSKVLMFDMNTSPTDIVGALPKIVHAASEPQTARKVTFLAVCSTTGTGKTTTLSPEFSEKFHSKAPGSPRPFVVHGDNYKSKEMMMDKVQLTLKENPDLTVVIFDYNVVDRNSMMALENRVRKLSDEMNLEYNIRMGLVDDITNKATWLVSLLSVLNRSSEDNPVLNIESKNATKVCCDFFKWISENGGNDKLQEVIGYLFGPPISLAFTHTNVDIPDEVSSALDNILSAYYSGEFDRAHVIALELSTNPVAVDWMKLRRLSTEEMVENWTTQFAAALASPKEVKFIAINISDASIQASLGCHVLEAHRSNPKGYHVTMTHRDADPYFEKRLEEQKPHLGTNIVVKIKEYYKGNGFTALKVEPVMSDGFNGGYTHITMSTDEGFEPGQVAAAMRRIDKGEDKGAICDIYPPVYVTGVLQAKY